MGGPGGGVREEGGWPASQLGGGGRLAGYHPNPLPCSFTLLHPSPPCTHTPRLHAPAPLTSMLPHPSPSCSHTPHLHAPAPLTFMHPHPSPSCSRTPHLHAPAPLTCFYASHPAIQPAPVHPNQQPPSRSCLPAAAWVRPPRLLAVASRKLGGAGSRVACGRDGWTWIHKQAWIRVRILIQMPAPAAASCAGSASAMSSWSPYRSRWVGCGSVGWSFGGLVGWWLVA